MRAFVTSALPWVLMGLALAIVAAHFGEKKGKEQDKHMALGAALGLMLGVALNGCGLWANHAIGIALGPLWGMALVCMFDKAEKTDPKDAEQAQSDGKQHPKDE